MKRYCLTLDLKDDAALISEYEQYHEKIWPEIMENIRGSGIGQMEIYRFGNRLFMIMETEDSFSFERKAKADAGNPKVQEWEQLMWKYQQTLPGAKPGEKWVLMNKIFDLQEQG
jgi:L-rhamnose mutarotase